MRYYDTIEHIYELRMSIARGQGWLPDRRIVQIITPFNPKFNLFQVKKMYTHTHTHKYLSIPTIYSSKQCTGSYY